MSSDAEQPRIILPDGGPDSQELDHERRKGPWIGVRHIFAFLGFLGFVNVYAMRVNLSVAIVAMVNDTSSSNSTNNTDAGTCPAPVIPANSTDDDNDNGDFKFDWDTDTQSMVLGCFFYGYVLTQMPGGTLAEIFGGKWIFGIGILMTSIFTVIMPWAAKTDLRLLVAVRVLEGLGEGVTFPVMHAMLAKWAPPLELSKMATFIYTGSTLGTIVSLPLTGIICDYLGWEAAFYIFGSCGIIWFIFWAFLVYERPEQHPRISQEEKDLILISRGIKPLIPVITRSASIDSSIVSDLDGSNIVYDDSEPIITISETKKKPKIPIKAIFTSVPFYAILIVHCCQNWGFYTLLTEMPTYLSQILHFDIKTNGFLSALPYVCMWIFANASSQIADYLRTKSILSTGMTRKVFNSLAFIIPALALILIRYAGCHKYAVVALLCVCVGFNGASFISINCNHIDIAPNFSGTLMGITNCLANTAGFLAPMLVGHITKKEDIDNWQTVFYIAAGVYVVGNILFCIMGSGEEQPWNKICDEEEENDPNILNSSVTGIPNENLGPIIPSTSQDLIGDLDN